jgi:molybdopterin-containing oxidoreductase family membrane subunit
VEISLFIGTIGMFLALFLLFLRFLPCINIAEVKWTLKESDPHHDDHHDHPDHGTEVVAAYQHELHGKGAVEAKA